MCYDLEFILVRNKKKPTSVILICCLFLMEACGILMTFPLAMSTSTADWVYLRLALSLRSSRLSSFWEIKASFVERERERERERDHI